jgi:hypothetical protein
MKGVVKTHKHRDTHPGDDLYVINLQLIELTEREFQTAMRIITTTLYPEVNAVALTPRGVP